MSGNNGLDKETQIAIGKTTKQKGDWAELIAAAYFRKLGYLVFPKMSGPIDTIFVHEKTGETRYVDVKTLNDRKNTKTGGNRINRTVSHPLKKILKIEIVYVDEHGNITFPYAKGREAWRKEYKVDRNEKGQYNGKIVKRNERIKNT